MFLRSRVPVPCTRTFYTLNTAFHPRIARRKLSCTSIKVNKERNQLAVSFDDGFQASYSSEFLRVYSPSAEMLGGAFSPRKFPGGRMHVTFMDVIPVGNYAIRIEFDDMHETGIYSWKYLRELGQNKWQLMKRYIEALKGSNKSRNPKKHK